MNQTILPPAIGKTVGQTVLFSHGIATHLREGNIGARDVMVIVAGYGHGDTSSNPGPD